MLKLGITGGIGSGKSTVCRVFETLGIPVFYADAAAKYLMENDAMVIDHIKMLFGNDIYNSGILNREKIASLVFQQPGLLQELNKIVHPATIRYGKQWMESQSAPYVIKEAAIFFESGSNTDMDVMVGVYAPRKLRILRAAERDNVSQEKILQRIAQQMDEDEKMRLCHYVITNDDVAPVIPQVLKLHETLLEKARQ